MTEPLRVLFVCTANIARSAYAEHRARQLAGAGAGIEFASAGVPGMRGRAMDAEMAAQLTARGGDPSAHLSRPVTTEILGVSDLVLTAEFGQRLRLIDGLPEAAPRIFGLRQAAQAVTPDGPVGQAFVRGLAAAAPPDSMTLDIRDPHRQGRRAAAACATEIDELLRILLPALTGTPLPPEAPPAPAPAKRRWPWSR